MPRPIRHFLIVASLLLTADAGIAQDDEGGCVYNRTVYPERSEQCQTGALMRCEEGAWAPIGLCDKEPLPEPVSSGGDEVLQPEE